MINADGAGTTVQDIRLENTGMWIYNTSNVTFTGVTFYVDNAYVCNGVGHVAVRYSNNITFDGCTVYTKNNGGSSACVLTPGHFYVFCDNSYRTYYFGSIRLDEKSLNQYNESRGGVTSALEVNSAVRTYIRSRCPSRGRRSGGWCRRTSHRCRRYRKNCRCSGSPGCG